MAEGSFPEPISLGARSVGWIGSEVDAWIAQRIAESRKTRPALQSVRQRGLAFGEAGHLRCPIRSRASRRSRSACSMHAATEASSMSSPV